MKLSLEYVKLEFTTYLGQNNDYGMKDKPILSALK